MHLKKDDRSYRAGKRAMLSTVLPALLAAVLLVQATSANGQAQDTSGTALLGNSLQYGNTSYSVTCSYPPTVEVGSNLTIAITLHVDSLTGLIEYLTNYGLVVEVFVGDQHLQGSVSSVQNSTFLYPGSNWGPNNVTIPLTANNTGLAVGESANATVSVTLRDTIYYGSQQLNVYVTEPGMQGAAGSLVIQNPAASTSASAAGQGAGKAYVPYAVLTSAGAVLMLWAAIWPRRPGSTRPGQKP